MHYLESLSKSGFRTLMRPVSRAGLRGQGNAFSIAVTMPLRSIDGYVSPAIGADETGRRTLPLPDGTVTGFGDVRFVDIAVVDAGYRLLFESDLLSYFRPRVRYNWSRQMAGWAGRGGRLRPGEVADRPLFRAKIPISFRGDDNRRLPNALFLQPFITYQLGRGCICVRNSDGLRLGDRQHQLPL